MKRDCVHAADHRFCPVPRSMLLMQSYTSLAVLQHAIIFSLSSPVSALVAYALLSGGGSQAISSERIGWGLLFSGGTFLFVAVAHILPEVLSSQKFRGTGWPIAFGVLMAGICTPILLTSGFFETELD
jgi:zinc transporter ZupT